MKTVAHILFVLCVGTVHWLFAAILIFYGNVLNPTLQHAVLNIVGLVLLLPFSPLFLLFPRLTAEGIDPYLGVLSGLVWAQLYWWLGSRCIRRLRSRSLHGTPTT